MRRFSSLQLPGRCWRTQQPLCRVPIRHPGWRRNKATLDEVLEAAGDASATSEVGEEDSAPLAGVDKKAASLRTAHTLAEQEGVLWFANIYPTKAFRFDIRQVFTHHNHETLIPQLLNPIGVEVQRMVPREREGGAFVYFRAPPSFVLQVLLRLAKKEDPESRRFVKKGSHQDSEILIKVCEGISGYLKSHDLRAFLSPFPVRAHRVRGRPYHEDLHMRYPSSRLRIRVEPAGKLSEEQMYAKLRIYGQLDDLEALPEGKGFRASFRHTAGAVAARNCLHRALLEDQPAVAEGAERPRFHIDYEPFMQKWLRDQLVANARYVLAFALFCMVGTTYFIWDPLRSFAVQLRIASSLAEASSFGGLAAAQNCEADVQRTEGAFRGLWGTLLRAWHRWGEANSQLLQATLLKRQGSNPRSLLADFWADRPEEVEELRHWLTQPQDKVMLLTGHRGNGQEAFVRQVLGGHAVFVDVGSMLEAGGSVDDQIFIRSLSRAFGYWPAQGMGMDKQMTALLDLMLPGSGKLSRDNEMLVAVQRVLSCVTGALANWRHRRRSQHSGGQQLADVAAPLFVIQGFTSENKDRREGFFESIVQWAAYVSEAGLARVLIIADSSFGEPAILGILRDRPERLDVQQLRDAELGNVRSILERRLGESRSRLLSDEELAAVGGRFRDISALLAHCSEGEAPKDAVRNLVEAAETTVRTLLLTGQPGVKWSRPQLWRAAHLLAEAGSGGVVPYDVFLWSVFRGDEAALRSMKESALIAVVPRSEMEDGCSQPDGSSGKGKDGSAAVVVGRAAKRLVIVPGSPLFGEVYRRLMRHHGLAAILDLEVAKEDIKREQTTLEGYEAQLVQLQQVDDVRREKGRSLRDPNEALVKRKHQLLELIMEQHKKLAKYHKERLKAQATLNQRSGEFHTSAAAAAAAVPVPGQAKKIERGGGLLSGFVGLFA